MHRNIRCAASLALSLLFMVPAALAGGSTDQKPVLGDVAAAGQAWEMINQGALLVDVRSAGEFADGYIDGATNIPHTEIERLVQLIGGDLDRPVVFYCRSGRRVDRAIAALQKLGYTGIFNATGYEALLATKPE